MWGNPRNCFLQIHALVSTITQSLTHVAFLGMEGKDIVSYQDEDSRVHRAWVQSNASPNTGKGSEPGSGSPAARIARRDPFEFDQDVLAVGHSEGNQSRESRGTRGSLGNSGYRGRTGRGPSSGSSTGTHAPTRGEHVTPPSPTRRTSSPTSPARDVHGASEGDERRGLKRTADSEVMKEKSTASGSQSKRRKNRGKRDKQSDEVRNHCRTLVLEWFNNHSMVIMEKQYLNNGTKGLELVKNELMFLLTEDTTGSGFKEDRGTDDWDV